MSPRSRSIASVGLGYLLLVAAPLWATVVALHRGERLSPLAAPTAPVRAPVEALLEIRTLLLQIAVITLSARLVGALARRLGQAQVVGEMIAGILLGPSVLGWVAPSVSRALFPDSGLALLGGLSQLGLVLFLFVIGLGHRPAPMAGYGRVAALTGAASICSAFALGVVVSLYLYPRLGTPTVAFVQFALFIGTSMSITAFPVLARILQEHRLTQTPLGTLAITCAAIDDVTGWILVGGVMVLLRGHQATLPVWASAAGVVVFACAMLTLGRRAMRRLARGGMTSNRFALALVFAIASASITERIGVHPIFGAFLAGVAISREAGFARSLRRRLEPVTLTLLLPLFFAWSGLRTQIRFIHGAAAWGYFGLIVAAAIAGKLSGAVCGALLSGIRRREALALGVLMNTRGLVELVVLNIGLSAGAISPTLFTLLVMMAIATTFMTAPLLRRIYPPEAR